MILTCREDNTTLPLLYDRVLLSINVSRLTRLILPTSHHHRILRRQHSAYSCNAVNNSNMVVIDSQHQHRQHTTIPSRPCSMPLPACAPHPLLTLSSSLATEALNSRAAEPQNPVHCDARSQVAYIRWHHCFSQLRFLSFLLSSSSTGATVVPRRPRPLPQTPAAHFPGWRYDRRWSVQ